MNKLVLCFLSVAVVSARCNAESNPALSKASNVAVGRSTEANEHGKQQIGPNDAATEVPNEERVFAIESFISSLKIADESLPLHAATTRKEPQIKERHIALKTGMKKLGINLDGVMVLVKEFEYTLRHFSRSNRKWMILGKLYFDAVASAQHEKVRAVSVFKEVNMKIENPKTFRHWTEKFNRLGIQTQDLFGKMLWLIKYRKELNLHLEDAAKMAAGSEFLNTQQLPLSNRIIQILSKHVVEEGVLKHLKRLDEDSEMKDLPGEKLLRKAIHENAADELQNEPIEPNKRKAVSEHDGVDQRVSKHLKRLDKDPTRFNRS